jgi:hypothetical protein
MYIEELDVLLANYIWEFLGDDRCRVRFYITDSVSADEYAGYIYDSMVLWRAYSERREDCRMAQIFATAHLICTW